MRLVGTPRKLVGVALAVVLTASLPWSAVTSRRAPDSPVARSRPVTEAPDAASAAALARTQGIRVEVLDQRTEWRKYDAPATKLTVRFNRGPNLPSDLSSDPPVPAPCRWCGTTPYFGDPGTQTGLPDRSRP